VRISILKGRSAAQRRALGDAVHRALVETIDVPALDRALYRRIAANLHESTGLRPEDVLVSLVEVGREDWSFGHGFASYAPETAETAPVPI
jgi:phenylpyruvate tautomerase PptA (4-oxalocrotonate tautomerase family)